jgi:antitoxin component HigA of HigAB toxin-antitoxin module
LAVKKKAYAASRPSACLCAEYGLKQTDMLDIFSSQGTVSQVLNGKREISKAQARKLSVRFRLPIDELI